MKKFLSVLMAICLMMMSSVVSFAAGTEDVSPQRKNELVQKFTSSYKMKTGETPQILSVEVERVDDLTLCKMLLVDNTVTRAAGYKTGHAVHAWFDDYDNHIGTIEIAADFEYSSSGISVTGWDYWASSMDNNADYDVTGEDWSDSGLFNKAYYKISYRFYYGSQNKSATLEVNCSNSGVLGDNGGTKNI